MSNPRAVQGILDATMPGLDDIGRNGADKSIKCPCTDGVDNAFTYPLRIKTPGGKAFSQHRFVSRTNLWPTHVVRAVARAASDIGVDRPGA